MEEALAEKLAKQLDKMAEEIQALHRERATYQSILSNLTVYVCIVNSTYFEDTLSHIEAVKLDKADAFKWRTDYENRVIENKGLVPPDFNINNESEVDHFLDVTGELLKAKKFLSCDIKEFKVT